MMFSPGSLPRGPKVEIKKALLLLDFQEDFTSPTGKLHVPNSADCLSKLPSLIAKFRERGPVIWVQTIFREPCSSLSPQTGGYSILMRKVVDHMMQQPGDDESANFDVQSDEGQHRRRLLPVVLDDEEAFLNSRIKPSNRCCLPNAKGSELSAELFPVFDKQKDWVLNKSQYSAFADFSLVMQLRARMINDLYICGSLSNIGVHATVLDAVQQGFNVTLVEDCIGYRDEMCHIEAVRRMADDLGANGTDYQELMDDLYGLLGDVIPSGRFSRRFQLSVQRGGGRTQISQAQKVSQWMETIESDSETDKRPSTTEKTRNSASNLASGSNRAYVAAPQHHESSVPPEVHREPPKYSPSRKRSTSDREDLGGSNVPHSEVEEEQDNHQGLPEITVDDHSLAKKNKLGAANTQTPSEPSQRPSTSPKISSPRRLGQSQSTSQLETSRKTTNQPSAGERAMSQPNIVSHSESPQSTPKVKRQKHKNETMYFGPNDDIGDGDTKIVHDVLKRCDADQMFSKLKDEIAWQKMYHRTGEVPRLVAVQGLVATDGSIPIYRHPADESPPMLPFDETVDNLRQHCEKLVGHSLNHVLIQYYRHSEDNISEHSDKTLDITRGSSIVNLSLGAMRTMTLRTKKSSQIADSSLLPGAEPSPNSADNNQLRVAQRVRLPHNSVFILGERTNANWMHSIRADKRPVCEKSEDELAFNTERISLTFRLIGTFIDPNNNLIWGQGATGKTREDAKTILSQKEAEVAGEKLIIGFGKENHCNESEFDWDAVYGNGFDVVNFEVKARDDSSNGAITN